MKEEIEKLKIIREQLCSKLADLNFEISKRESEYKKGCRHPQLLVEKEYASGSYYDREEYITKLVCSDCGQVVKTTIEYGGYG